MPNSGSGGSTSPVAPPERPLRQHWPRHDPWHHSARQNRRHTVAEDPRDIRTDSTAAAAREQRPRRHRQEPTAHGFAKAVEDYYDAWRSGTLDARRPSETLVGNFRAKEVARNYLALAESAVRST